MQKVKESINAFLRKAGYQIVKKDTWRPKFHFEKLNIPSEIKSIIQPNTMLYEIRQRNIIDTTNYILNNDIPGDFVECGVWKGGSVALMAYQLKKKGQARTLHLFDAFDDICQPDAAVDGENAIKLVGGMENAQGKLKPVEGVYADQGGSGNEREVKELITNKIGYEPSLVRIHKGWFQDTLPVSASQINKIALLRLDGDWYASTKVCLENLYDKLVPGGVIIIDDYRAYDGCKKAVDEFLSLNNLKPFIINVDDYCVYWIKSPLD